MEVELELITSEKEEIQVLQRAMDLAKKAKELGFSFKELKIETEDNGKETEKKEE